MRPDLEFQFGPAIEHDRGPMPVYLSGERIDIANHYGDWIDTGQEIADPSWYWKYISAFKVRADHPIYTQRPAHVPRIFLDCDGVLADFDSYAHDYFGMNPRDYEDMVGSATFWKRLEAKGDFYRNLPLMADARELYEGVKHLNPTILTGCPRGDWAQGQKVAWAAEQFPGVPIITCRSADKRDHAKAGDVLIDDWAQHRHRWIEMGGIFITHHCAKTSLAALWAHYPKLKLAEAA